MKVLIAPNSMKGSLSAFEFADTVEQAFIESTGDFDIRKVPVADGGDFTGEVLQHAFEAKNISIKVHGPLGVKIESKYAVFGNTAIIEMADASGMKLIECDLLNPMKTSTFGTGELILDAIKKSCNEIFLAVGGSATVDGGMGMMEALGFRFFDKNNNQLIGNGNNLNKVKAIKKPNHWPQLSIKIICDVNNPLLGKTGAATIFGPQKGAAPEMVELLESGLANWANILQQETGIEVSKLAGTGAAGGIAVPLISFFDADIVPGADFVLTQLNIENQIKWADIVITGEGKLDIQTLNNKAPFAVARMAKKNRKKVYAFTGVVDNFESEIFEEIFPISDSAPNLNFAILHAKELLYNAAFKLAKQLIQKC